MSSYVVQLCAVVHRQESEAQSLHSFLDRVRLGRRLGSEPRELSVSRCVSREEGMSS